MFGCPSRSSVLLVCLLIYSLAAQAQQDHGPQRVPVPVPPSAKRASSAKKDRSGLPPVPTFKDIAKDVGLRFRTQLPPKHIT